MDEDKLAEALAEYKQAIEEEVRLERELLNAKNKDSALIQAKKDAEKLYSQYSDANDAWQELNNKFNSEHEQLLESVDDAWRYRCEVEKLIAGIISKQKGEPDEW